MKLFCDMHIHTALSPCGDNEMTPCNIVGLAMLAELDVIAVCDHNSCRNVRAVTEASQQCGGPLVVAGMELETAETVHMICLFPSVDVAEAFAEQVYHHLPDIPNRPEIFGDQLILSADDETVGIEPRLLVNATDLDIYDAVRLVKSYGGACYPAHIDRPSNGILAILGAIPDDLGFCAVEISSNVEICQNASKELQNVPLSRYNLFYGSDAHYLENMAIRDKYLEVEYLSVNRILALAKRADE